MKKEAVQHERVPRGGVVGVGGVAQGSSGAARLAAAAAAALNLRPPGQPPGPAGAAAAGELSNPYQASTQLLQRFSALNISQPSM